jgi:hypothetical protein
MKRLLEVGVLLIMAAVLIGCASETSKSSGKAPPSAAQEMRDKMKGEMEKSQEEMKAKGGTGAGTKDDKDKK